MENQMVKFIKLTSWAIPPVKEKVTIQEYSNPDLRWNHKTRVKGACWPYKMGKQVGWTIVSPLDIQISPVEELQVSGSEDDLDEVGQMHGIDFWVKRGSTYIGLKPDGWFRYHQAKVNGVWRNLLIPNGECTFEWALGWGLEIPEDYVVLFQTLEGQDSFTVHPGLLQSDSLAQFTSSGLGISLAFEPRKEHFIRRGDPIAKLLVFHKSALTLTSEVVEGVELLEPLERT